MNKKIKKILLYLTLSYFSVNSFAVCNVNVDTVSFGDLKFIDGTEYETSGFIHLICDSVDIGKTMNVKFNIDELNAVNSANLTKINLRLFIQNNRVLINTDYGINISNTTLSIPFGVKINMLDNNKYQQTGMYTNNLMLTYTY